MRSNVKQIRKKLLASFAVALVCVGVLSLCIFHNMTMAAGSYYNKATTSALIDCINKGIFKTSVNTNDLNGSYWAFTSTSGGQTWVPLGFTSDTNLSQTCSSIIQKMISNKGLSVPKASSSFDEKDKFLRSLGYRKNDSGTSQESQSESCFRLIYNSSTDGTEKEAYSQYVCVKTDSKGNIVGDAITTSGSSTVKPLSLSGGNNSLTIKYNNNGSSADAWGSKKVTVSLRDGSDSSFEGFKNRVKNKVIEVGASKNSYSECYETGVCYTTTYNLLSAEGSATIQDSGSGDISAEYTLTIDDNSKRLITGTLLGSSTNTYPSFSDDEQFNMYEDYLNSYYKADTHCEWTEDLASQKKAEEGYTEVTSCSADGEAQPCYAKATANANKKVGGIQNHQFGHACDFNCVASWLASYGKTNNTCPAKTEETEETPVTPGSTNNSSSTTSKCETVADQVTDGKIGAMQWILCPTMDNMESTASWIDGLTQDWLEVKTDLYDSGSKAFEVWGIIRNIANVLMIVFMMIVVISQLTGKGIDNYGIKKMLPRLITMAILVNLSFYICEIAIDLSNILGTGLRDMFSAVGNYAGRDYIDTMTTGFMAAAGAAGTGGGAAVGVGITAVTLGASVAVAAIIAVIVLCLVILVAVMVLFLMLGAREVMIIFCIIIAPLAFAAFILPNTQNLFKKWWSVFEAALIIFPICGALSGISNLLRSMASNGTELSAWAYAVVLVLPYLGFFLLPMLLKNAIASMGKLGGALTSLGNTVRNGGRAAGQGVMKVAQQTEGYKNLQTEAARRRQQQSSQRTIDRLEALKKQKEAEGGKLSDKDAMRLYEARQTQNKLRLEQGMAQAGAVDISDEAIANRAMSAKEAQEFKNYTDQYGGYTRAQMGDELQSAVAAYDSERSEGNALRLQAAIATAESRGMNQEMLNYIGGYHKDDNGNDVLDQPLLSLSASNANDAKILSRLSSSNNKVISQYGIQMSKPTNVDQTLSMGGFASSAGPVRMSEAFANKGPAILNNMDDDTLEYINKRGGNQPVVSSAMLANAAASTTNQKELRQINDMFGKMDANKISFSGRQLANFDNSTVQTLMNKVKSNPELQKNFVAATNDIANSPELMGSLRPEQREMFNAVRKGAGVAEMGTSTSVPNNSNSNSNPNSTPTQTGGHTPTFEGGAGI